MNQIAQQIAHLQGEMPQQTTLVCVSKFHPIASLQCAYDAGQRIFAESRVQELLQKVEALPNDIEWHFIGHLQTNKVKQVIPHVALIHSVDSLRLLQAIEQAAAAQGCVSNCLIQIHIAQEEQKFGFSYAEWEEYLQQGAWRELTHVRLCGLMGMATYTDDITEVEQEFTQLKHYFDQIKSQYFPHDDTFKELSMGMSGDYKEAIAAGSTMVRIGSTIFGARILKKNLDIISWKD